MVRATGSLENYSDKPMEKNQAQNIDSLIDSLPAPFRWIVCKFFVLPCLYAYLYSLKFRLWLMAQDRFTSVSLKVLALMLLSGAAAAALMR